MNVNLSNPETLAVVVVIVAALIALAVILTRAAQRKQSLRLRERFGPEYARAVAKSGNRTKAEAELVEREKRVARLKIVPLSAAEAARFSDAWGALQTRFVDNPNAVVADADLLVRELMVKRGYPMSDFEHRAADISVDHPAVVDAYRSARAIAVRAQRNEASTEDLRKAVVFYRTLFDELLEVRQPRQAPAARTTEVVHS